MKGNALLLRFKVEMYAEGKIWMLEEYHSITYFLKIVFCS